MLHEKIDEIKKELIEYAVFIQTMIEKSIKGLATKNRSMLRDIINKDEKVANWKEVKIEEMVFTTMAKFEPKAVDLRTLLMVNQMNNDLERIGDMAVNICDSSLQLIEKTNVEFMADIEKMGQLAKDMLRDSVDSFINSNVPMARGVCERDDVVDEINRELIKKSIDYMNQNNSDIDAGMHLLRISRNLERLADLSTNISENVIFMVEGRVIKHHHDEKPQPNEKT